MNLARPAGRRTLPALLLSAVLVMVLLPAFGAAVLAGNDPAASSIVPLADFQPTISPSAEPDSEPASPTPTSEASPSGDPGGESDQPTDPPTDSPADTGLVANAMGMVLVLLAIALLVLLLLPVTRARRG